MEPAAGDWAGKGDLGYAVASAGGPGHLGPGKPSLRPCGPVHEALSVWLPLGCVILGKANFPLQISWIASEKAR